MQKLELQEIFPEIRHFQPASAYFPLSPLQSILQAYSFPPISRIPQYFCTLPGESCPVLRSRINRYQSFGLLARVDFVPPGFTSLPGCSAR
jgi:hypothetical protein